jgi:CBS domain-containing protein
MMDSPVEYAIAMREALETFEKLSPDTLRDLRKRMTEVTLDPGATLFREDDAYGGRVYVIDQGTMELRRNGAAPVALGEGDVLCLDSLFDQLPYRASAVATSDVTLGALTDEHLGEVEEDRPELFQALQRLLTQRMRDHAARRLPVTGVWSIPARAVMKSPLATCGPDVTVTEAFDLMRQRGIGSLGVVDKSKRLLGMMTFATLAEGMLKKGAHAHDSVVDSVCEAPEVIEPDAPLWKVQSEQARLGVKYLVVCDAHKPAGVISQTDVLKTIISYQRSIIVEIGDAGDYAQLKAFNARLGQIARELQHRNRSAGMAVRALSEIHLAIQRRCIELVLQELREAGKGEAPVPYAFIIMGSGGRKEMIIQTDQDNGIILADTPHTTTRETQEWFEDFCDRVNHRLDEVGYEWCKGDIMARNPDFHRSLSQWRQHLTHIAGRPTEKSARWSTVFFDFDTLYGDDSLSVELRNHLLAELERHPRLLKMMVEDDASGRPAVGLFNRLVTASDKERKGKVDLKRNGTRLLADAARVYALSEGIDATNTGDRIRALVRQGRFDAEFAESVLAALDELLDFTLDHQIEQLEQGVPLDKLVDPEELTPLELEWLRMAMRVTKTFQGRLQGDFGTTML